MSRRWICHIDCDAFFASVEQALDPTLRGKPLVVGGAKDGSGIVITSSYLARDFGVRTGMTVYEARQRCPDAVFVYGNHSAYAEMSMKIHEILTRFAQYVEPASIDEYYCDFTGTPYAFENRVPQLLMNLQKYIYKELGITVSIGLASNKFCAKMASDYRKPNGFTYVPHGKERHFLRDIPIKNMIGVGRAMFPFFTRMGVRRIGDVCLLSKDTMKCLHGKNGVSLWDKARGICHAPVKPVSERKSVGHMVTFKRNTADRTFIIARLLYLIEKCAFRVRGLGVLCSEVSVYLRFDDFSSKRFHCSFLKATCFEKEMREVATSLLERSYSFDRIVRTVGVSFGRFSKDSYQLDIFGSRSTNEMKLASSVDAIRSRYGFRSVMTARSFLGKDDASAIGAGFHAGTESLESLL